MIDPYSTGIFQKVKPYYRKKPLKAKQLVSGKEMGLRLDEKILIGET
jgi:hypothetical protein